MTLFPGFAAEDGSRSAQEVLNYPIGAASPLWLAYAGAAGAGVAYWWMTRWTQPANLEAAFGSWFEPAAAEPALFDAPTVPAVAEPAAEIVEAAAEETIEAVVASVEAVTEAVEPVVETLDASVEETAIDTAVLADDLTRLVGIGPKLAARLGDLGVRNFKDIAAWTEADLERFDQALDLKGRAVRDAWIAQARRLSEG